MKKSFKTAFILLAAAIILLALWVGSTLLSLRQYNSEIRSDKTDTGLSVVFKPRGGSSDSWVKIFSDGRSLTGKIYEMNVTNLADCDIPEWTERIEITADCYLNSGWCGTFEILQHAADGTVRETTIDLRNYANYIGLLKIDYQLEGQDLMIPLKKGDTVIYHPSAAVFETPLQKAGVASVGFILYYEGTEPDFSQAEASFRYNMLYKQTKSYKPQVIALCLWGVALIVTVSLAIYSKSAEQQLEAQKKRLEESFSVFSGFVDAKDTYTNGHSKRVALYSMKIAEAMGYTHDAALNVYYTGLMHDCGKCCIPDDILKKPGRLTNDEFAVIKTHPACGADLLKDFNGLSSIKDGVLYHHERYDGKGYPAGLSGKDIPEIGRILCVADAFDAMSSCRVYRPRLSNEVILSELRNGRGTQFDPDILDVFLGLIDAGKVSFTSTDPEA